MEQNRVHEAVGQLYLAYFESQQSLRQAQATAEQLLQMFQKMQEQPDEEDRPDNITDFPTPEPAE